MSLSKLKLNSEKTEFIVFGYKAPYQKISSLSVFLVAFSEHVKMTCKVCFLQMRDLLRIRQYLTPEVTVTAANALVSSRLGYCNSA